MVLKSPDIPSMLVETAFISNREDERKLVAAGASRQARQRHLRGNRAVLSGQCARRHAPRGRAPQRRRRHAGRTARKKRGHAAVFQRWKFAAVARIVPDPIKLRGHADPRSRQPAHRPDRRRRGHRAARFHRQGAGGEQPRCRRAERRGRNRSAAACASRACATTAAAFPPPSCGSRLSRHATSKIATRRRSRRRSPRWDSAAKRCPPSPRCRASRSRRATSTRSAPRSVSVDGGSVGEPAPAAHPHRHHHRSARPVLQPAGAPQVPAQRSHRAGPHRAAARTPGAVARRRGVPPAQRLAHFVRCAGARRPPAAPRRGWRASSGRSSSNAPSSSSIPAGPVRLSRLDRLRRPRRAPPRICSSGSSTAARCATGC